MSKSYPPTKNRTFWQRLVHRLGLSRLTAEVKDQPAWMSLDGGRHERASWDIKQSYTDSLKSWRENPLAWRIVALVRDHVLGDGVRVSSPIPELENFIRRFWNHPRNRMELRLEALVDELTRSGDLFILLFRNPTDGMSFLRCLTKDEIVGIITEENDRESELVYLQADSTRPGIRHSWLSPTHPEAGQAEAVCLHYSINRPVGALMGESDLAPLIPWLERYDRMVLARAELHWALRTFLWFIRVPEYKIEKMMEKHKEPPDQGSVMVVGDDEHWEMHAPPTHAADARHDLQAIFRSVAGGSGLPGHWLGDQETANLATARASQAPAERALKRRQQYFMFILQDVLYTAYQRAQEIGRAAPLPSADLAELFAARGTDISRDDNLALAQAAEAMARGLNTAASWAANRPAFHRKALEVVFRAAGESLGEADLREICRSRLPRPVPAAAPAPESEERR